MEQAGMIFDCFILKMVQIMQQFTQIILFVQSQLRGTDKSEKNLLKL